MSSFDRYIVSLYLLRTSPILFTINKKRKIKKKNVSMLHIKKFNRNLHTNLYI